MAKKFGTFKGVFVPSTEAILGTVLFLLLPMLTADMGLAIMLIIIILAHTVTLATSFSIADCATNLNTIGGGGMYALSKRSLGLAFGGSIGIQLYLAQAASIGFYCIGFSEPLQPILEPLLNLIPMFQGSGRETLLLQKQVIATAMLVIFLIIVLTGADFTLKIQTVILIILIGSIAAIVISPMTGNALSIKGLFVESIADINLSGNRAITLSIFFASFTQFFPAVTGIDAGVGMSGDLKEPGKSLVRGTFSAIAVTFVVYIAAAVIFALMNREAVIVGYVNGDPTGNLLTVLLGLGRPFPFNALGVMVLMGILFATSSSALSCFMTAPRTMQSLCRDRLLPSFMNFLARDFSSRGREPRVAAIFTFFIGLGVIWMGSLNMAAMVVGICYLVVYGWINGAAFFERISNNPSFRPTSRGHWLISLYGFLAAMSIIILFDWVTGILILVSQYILFRLILKYKAKNKLEGVWWGVLFSFISWALKTLEDIVQGTKNWRPILIAIAFGKDKHGPEKIGYLANLVASYKGMVNYNVIVDKKGPGSAIDVSRLPIVPRIVQTDDWTESARSMVQMNNFINLKSNTVLLEYSEQIDMVDVIRTILSLDKNLLLLKNSKKLLKQEKIDIWWRGERNGNLMVLIAYIIGSSLNPDEKKAFGIRILRRLDRNEDRAAAEEEMQSLLVKARLAGKVHVLDYSESDFIETVIANSMDSDLILMGIPGNFVDRESKKIFDLNEIFFRREIHRYDVLPAILFVRCPHVFDLIED